MPTWARAGLVLVAVLALDQGTKALVRGGIRVGDEDPVFPALKLVHVRNEGVAFGLQPGGGTLVIVLVSLALLGVVLLFAVHRGRPWVWLPTGLLVGGALGNVVDRLHQGFVTDFLKVPLWPAFNVADVAITTGVVALVLVLEGGRARHDPA